MNTHFSIFNLIKIIALFVIVGVAVSIVLGLLSGVLWLAIKILIPVAIAVWLVRLIVEPRKSKRSYY